MIFLFTKTVTTKEIENERKNGLSQIQAEVQHTEYIKSTRLKIWIFWCMFSTTIVIN